jgi:hypothetical protein
MLAAITSGSMFPLSPCRVVLATMAAASTSPFTHRSTTRAPYAVRACCRWEVTFASAGGLEDKLEEHFEFNKWHWEAIASTVEGLSSWKQVTEMYGTRTVRLMVRI